MVCPKRPIPRVMSRPRKVPTTALSLTCQNADMQTAGWLTGGRVRRRTIRCWTIDLRHRGSRQPPQGPAWPRGNYLPDVGVFPLCRQEDYYYCRIRAGIPYIYWRLNVLPPNHGLCCLLGDLCSRSHNLTFL